MNATKTHAKDIINVQIWGLILQYIYYTYVCVCVREYKENFLSSCEYSYWLVEWGCLRIIYVFKSSLKKNHSFYILSQNNNPVKLGLNHKKKTSNSPWLSPSLCINWLHYTFIVQFFCMTNQHLIIFLVKPWLKSFPTDKTRKKNSKWRQK